VTATMGGQVTPRARAGRSPRRIARPAKSSLAAPAWARGRAETFALYRLAVHLPAGAVGGRFSRQHPALRIELDNRMEVGRGIILADGKLFGPGAAEAADEVRGYPGVHELHLHAEAPDVVFFRLTFATPRIHEVARRHGILTRYPIQVQDGWMRFDTIATRSQVRRAVADMSRRVGATRIEAKRRRVITLGSLGLTPSQEATFRAAAAEGYFDVPRRITLTGLARRLNRSLSSTSESMARIRRQLTSSALEVSSMPGPVF
jgi:hypothetical protein